MIFAKLKIDDVVKSLHLPNGCYIALHPSFLRITATMPYSSGFAHLASKGKFFT